MSQKIKEKSVKVSELIRIILPIMLLLALIVAVFQSQRQQNVTGHAQVATCTVSVADLTIDSEEQALLQLVNTYRQQNNLPVLKFSAGLNKAAAWQSRDMATNNYLSHTDSLGRLPAQRLTDCGYNTFNVANGENIAGNTTDANATFTQWKNSPVHNANMLTRNFVVAGIARSYNANSTLKWYWVLDFVGQDDSTVTPSQAQPSQTLPSQSPFPTDTLTPTSPFVTLTPNCLGSCITMTPIPDTATPTQSIEQPTETPGVSISISSVPVSPIVSVSPSTVPGGSQPGTRLHTKSLLTLLLGIIALLLEFIKKLI